MAIDRPRASIESERRLHFKVEAAYHWIRFTDCFLIDDRRMVREIQLEISEPACHAIGSDDHGAAA